MSPAEHQVDRRMFSVVVPTFRRADRLRITLRALEQQTLSKDQFEVIISDDGSEDGTLEAIAAYKENSQLQIRVATGANGGPSVARNRGLALAEGAWVAFTDDDCVPAPDWLHRLQEILEEDPAIDGLGGSVSRYHDSSIARYVDWTGVLLPDRDEQGAVRYLVTSNAVFRTSLLKSLDGFDETYKWPGGEDPDLSFRAIAKGARLIYRPEAVVQHMHRETVKGTYRMFWHHGLGAGAHAELTGVPLKRSFTKHLRRSTFPNMRKAFEQRSLGEGVLFSYLELVRAIAFYKGYHAHDAVAGTGSTSAN